MSDIFISYASSDKDKAKTLADVLMQQGWSVWWDREIPPGKSFDEVIEENLNAARCILVLWSENSVKSNWVKEEATEGSRRNILVPVMIADVGIPLGFRRLQAARITDWEGQMPHPEVDKLLKAIKAILGHGESESEREDTTHGASTDAKEKDSGQLRERPSGRKVEGGVEHKPQADKGERQKETPDGKSRLPWLQPAIIVLFIIGVVVLVFLYKPDSGEVDREGKSLRNTNIEKEAEEPKPTVNKEKEVALLKKDYTAKDEVETSVIPETKFRSTPKGNLSEESVKIMLKQYNFFCREKDWSKGFSNPGGSGFDNKFVKQNNGQVVYDHASGLTWQQSGFGEYMIYEEAKAYIIKLNSEQFAGYNDWRLPTLEEAMSLMEPSEKNGYWYIDPVFDNTQKWIWTSDLKGASSAWVVSFSNGRCDYYDFYNGSSVRAVR